MNDTRHMHIGMMLSIAIPIICAVIGACVLMSHSATITCSKCSVSK